MKHQNLLGYTLTDIEHILLKILLVELYPANGYFGHRTSRCRYTKIYHDRKLSPSSTVWYDL